MITIIKQYQNTKDQKVLTISTDETKNKNKTKAT